MTATPRCFVSSLLLLGLTVLSAHSSDYYVSTNGNDSDNGTAGSPWRTIQKASATMLPGDRTVVESGVYAERISTTRPGMSLTNRITFVAHEDVTVLGFVINHPYVTVSNFHISGHSAASVLDSHVRVNANGDSFELLDCTVRDGIQLVRSDVVFNSQSRTIRSDRGGFVDAGFAPGQTLYIGAATNALSISSSNSGTHTITSVTDNSITVTGPLVDQGPLPIYFSASLVYGLSINNGATDCVIRNNVFRNLGYDAWFITGSRHLLENNVIEQVNGWDAMHFGGSNHVFHRNVIRNSPLVIYQISPDAMENYSPTPYYNVTFTNNFVQGFIGVLASQKGQNTMSGLLITRNVFVDVGRFSLTHPGTILEHNTFLRVAKEFSAVHSRASHPVFVNASVGATNISLINNIFVDCGEPSNNQSSADVGWYEIIGPSDSVLRTGNFVSGSPPLFPAKIGWTENEPFLNGGDPGFINMSDPLGPDELPFTDDDGLRLAQWSKLINAGHEKETPGAYEAPVTRPSLSISHTSAGQVRVLLSTADEEWVLQSAPSLNSNWSTLSNDHSPGQLELVLNPVGSVQFFRLSR